ncbi:Methyltransferase small domain-containing protein [uncultured Alphaproteobacteria bacterium]|uniref:Methyltransferase small domain-containing protein n=1 Tax=uncultured Alphaproteobacteria bacterium TaxID=91750 RepID=A0A212KLV3_9PROT|nr:Methyltransferase small domain-containing protein [uncultured Alphaproteobacteria bacterium]
MDPGDDIEVSEDGLLGGRVRLLQPRTGYRAAVDPVLLAAAARPEPGTRVLDLGCGTGAAALCLAARCGEVRVLGVEMQADYAALARRSAALSGLAERLTVVEGDARDLRALPSDWRPFDWAIANPPYFLCGNPAADAGRAQAHHGGAADLGEWVAAAAKALRPRGGLALVHQAERLDDALAALAAAGFGAVEVIPLWPKAGRVAKRVLVRGEKGRKTRMTLLPGLVLHREDGNFTETARRILFEAESLDAALKEGGC